jgi:hypothetical protein
MKDVEIEAAVRGIPWPKPGRALRARVLMTPVVTMQAGWSDRIWFSRAWRIAAAAILVFAVSIVWLDRPRLQPPLATAQAKANAQAVELAGDVLGLPAEFTASLLRRTLDVGSWPMGRERRQAAFDIVALDGDPR